MSKLLITGGAGFIGSHVARAAVAAGHEVAVLALPAEPLNRIADLADRAQILRGDLADVSSIHRLAASFAPNACIHLAWCVQPGSYQDDPQNVAMLSASLDLLEVLADVGCEYVVTAGTCAEYCPSNAPLTEQSTEGPDTLYGACKLAVRHVGGRIAALRSLGFAHARTFFLFGPGEDRRRAVPALIDSLLADEPFPASAGTQVRDYLHVADVAAALLAIVEQRANGVFNICSGRPVTMRELMSTAARLIGDEHLIQFGAQPLRSWDPPFIVGDNTRLRQLGWQPAHTLVSGLSDTIDSLRQLHPLPSL